MRELQQLLVDWNDTRREYPRGHCIQTLFEAVVDRAPDAIAVEFAGAQLSYRELDRRANQLAHHLRTLGVAPDVLVGLCVERSLDMVIGVLGILKAGGAYVPLDPSYPTERLALMLEDAAPPVLVSRGELAERLAGHPARIVRLDDPELVRGDASRPSLAGGPEDLAYVDFTSGSTGRPKGVCVPHRAVVRLVRDTNYIAIRPDDVFVQLSPIAFDASTFEIWGALLSGAKLVVFPPHTPTVDEIGRVLVDHKVTVLFLTSVLFHQMVDHRVGDLAGLRCLLTGGDVLSIPRMQRAVEVVGGTVMAVYGPTENTTFTTFYVVPRTLGTTTVPIGRPISNTTVYILDPAGQPVPVGVEGELYTGGDGLARGYLHRPTLTAERFLPNPFGPGQLYRTGDLVRWLADGNIEFLGRLDHQVKIRGFRVELGEVEVALGQCPGVKDTAVIAREDRTGNKRLLAYLTAASAPPPTTAALRDLLGKTLPDYMIPAAFVWVDRMPLTPNGKIDHRALPAPDIRADEDAIAPQTAIEQAIAQIWGFVLDVASLGRDDDFFELGGYSLAVTEASAQIFDALGVKVDFGAFLEHSTVAGLAAALLAGAGDPDAVVRRAERFVAGTRRGEVPAVIPRHTATGPVPLAMSQERLWLIERVLPGDAVRPYNETAAYTFVGALDRDALCASLRALADRHEILRTVFVEHDGVPAQRAGANPFAAPIAFLDLRTMPPAAHRGKLEALAADDSHLALLDTAEPPVRARLLQLADTTHVLLMTTHHAITDGWSDGIFLRELAELYRAALSGQPPRLAPLAIQYADFAVWQRDRLRGAHLQAELDYWTDQLRGAPPSIALPVARSSRLASFRGARMPFSIAPTLGDALRELARQERSTLFMPLLAAFAALLFRYSDQDDLPIGTMVANRDQPQTQNLIGFFTNTAVLRANLAGDPSVRELIAHVRAVVLAAQAHQEVPFDQVVAALGASRTDGKNPLFQIAFAFEEPARGVDLAPGLQVELEFLHNGTSTFDLTLAVMSTPGGLIGLLDYNPDLFDRATIERMAGHYQTLLTGMVADPARRISELPLLTEREHHDILVAWRGRPAANPEHRCLHELFEAQVDRAPDAIAVALDGARLTYQQLDRRANQLAHHLVGLGVGPEVKVGICVERSFEMIIGLLGILKAGGAYVPIDPRYPRDRIAFMLEDAEVAVLLTQERFAGTLEAGDARLVCLDTDGRAFTGATARLPGRVTGAHLAYVIYTSGSTGRPKGVQIEHRMVANLVRGFGEVEAMSPSDQSLGFSSFAFDGSVDEIFTPLTHGATLVLRGEDVPTAAELFGDRFAGVTIINITTAYWHALASELERGNALPATLRLVNIGGERAHPEHVAAWHARAPGCSLQNLYGPTETTAIAAVWRLHPDQLRPGREVPIGSPLPGYTAYVLDANRRPVPVGVPGELYLGGAGVARGYLHDPALTAERFMPDPFGSGRLYRTGDLVRWFPDGNLEYLGRRDHQVKIRGFRIELGEIESVLARHPAVRDAAVVAREDVPGDPRLVAYVVGRDGAVSAAELRGFLRARLPDHMVPFGFVALDALPINANGKVDAHALPAPDSPAAADRFVAPRTPAEQLLAGIWAAVLKRERVGVDDDFFALGGHSLLATQVVSRVRQAFQVELPLRSLFESPTVARLATAITTARGEPPPPIEPIARDGELAPSFAQQRLWFLEQIAPGGHAYSMSQAIQLTGALDTAALARALDGIVARHEVLRTTFTTREGRPVQAIAPARQLELPIVDVASRDQALALATEAARRPFDLARGPLFGATLLRLGAHEHWLLLAMHHIVSDLWSMAVFMEELAALYDGRELSPLRIQYADFAAWQRAWLAGDVLERQLAYWRTQLAGTPTRLELPTDRPRPAVLGTRGARMTFHVAPALTRALEAVSREHAVTLFMTLLAAFQVLLHRYSRQDDVVVGSPVANRNRAETEALIGFFINTLVLRTDLSGDPSFRTLLGRVRDVALGAYGHQDVPFERLVEELHPERNLSHTPVFQVMFALENAQPEPALPGLTLSPIHLDTGMAKFDLMLAMEHRPDGLAAEFEYNTDLFDAPTIERMAGHFQQLLADAVARPAAQISELALLGPDEHHRIVRAWNATAAAGPAATCAHQLFAAQVARVPDAVAVIAGDLQLSYRELDRRANQLAHHLRQCGVRRDVTVGLCVERSVHLVVGLLGILKAGGAYVPLDPSYPADRLAFMLRDAAIGILITESRVADAVPDAGALVICLDDDAAALDGQPTTEPPAELHGDNLAYVIYTSGSTGLPKGVMVTHRGLVNYLSYCLDSYGVADGAGAPVHSSIAFDLTVTSLLSPLTAGRPVVLIPDAEAVDGLASSLRERAGFSLVKLTPSHLRLLEHQLAPSDATGCAGAFIIGGEALPARALQFWQTHAPATRLINEYGPTETVVGCCVHEVTPADVAAGTVPIGRPIANTELYVLDADMNPVPVGVPGELYIGGVQLARGYLRRPGLTAERFVPSPFGTPGTRLYRSGDLARYRADGCLDYLGRIDQQVKIRGFRIEPGEIEVVLAEHPSVRDAIVVVRDAPPDDKRLIAYVLGDAAPDVAAWRAHLAARLPEYMVPSAFVVLDALPVHPNGKVNRGALPPPDRAMTTGWHRHVAPRTATELALVQIFERLLGVTPVGAHDDFFALGGHSLLALQLVSAISARLRVELPITALFTARSVEALARLIDEQAVASASDLIALRSEGDGSPVVLVHPVGGTVFCYLDLVARLAPGRPCYAIQARGLSGSPVESVAAMARDYVALVEHQLGGGPYHLIGWSFGGVIALEMARLRAAAGRSVASLTLLDSYAAASRREPPPDPRDVILWFARDLGLDLARDDLAGLDRDQALARVATRATAAALLPGHVAVPQLTRALRVFEANLAAGLQHHAQPFHGNATLITAADGEPGVDPSHGFRALVTGHVDLLSAPGDHDSLLRPPHVATVARMLDELLAKHEARRAASPACNDGGRGSSWPPPPGP